MKDIRLIFFLLFISSIGFSQEIKDTINISINLKQVDSTGLKVNVYIPSDLRKKVEYQFPVSIPGIYENLKNQSNFITFDKNSEIINISNNSYKINTADNKFHYSVKNSVNNLTGIAENDFYFLKDSIYIFNWHFLIGYFQNNINKPYKIKIIKNKKLFGAGGLSKKIVNDTTDIYTANNYKELIHHPIIYSIPDTISFRIGNTKFNIACSGNDTLLNSKKIKELIYTPLLEIYNKSNYKHKEYSFLYYSNYSLSVPFVKGLEHPNSTIICYHSALLDNEILISSSIHEFIHSIYAPLRIRSEVINNFDFKKPYCDEFLWFYEGVTEYLAIKTLTLSKFISRQQFLKELNENNNFYRNINLSKISSKIYKKKGQRLFENFYSKGSLFALQLDYELLKRSNGKTSLFDVMQKLQKLYTPEKPFNSTTFIDDFSKISGIDIIEYINKQTRKRTKIDFEGLINKIGYTKKLNDTIIWTFNTKKTYIVKNFVKNRLEITIFGSAINKKFHSKKITIFEINGKPLTWYNADKFLNPENGKEVSFKAYKKGDEIEIKAKPEKKKINYINWIKNENINSKIADKFWNE